MAKSWNNFWFDPVSTSTLGMLRIAFGSIVFLWTMSIVPDALAFFGEDGVIAPRDLAGLQLGLLDVFPHDWAVFVCVVALLVASVATAAGYHTRMASAVVFIVLLSLRRRNPWVMNSGDSMLRYMSFFLMLAPAGAALSLDRWRSASETFWHAPLHAPWALRLIQIQVSLAYLFAVWSKAQGAEWAAGTAVASSLRLGDLTRFEIPLSWSESLLLANVLTYGTIAVELALAVLVWNRRARPWVIAAGVVLHLGIEVAFGLGFFSAIMLVSYISFLPEDRADRLVDRVSRRLRVTVAAPRGGVGRSEAEI
ncbi:HTTM domain-containing protein [Acidimicrobiia bacterium EGI L10123]|uniref:HTTM domain-containing protein n=1 Tax=Salinilacustrithrix flava TaxID=2957203 RepID=UPI003D7C34B3|nr:HTTM domain-containing protein [Acidimicrobiia bacterium EGI L10123]